MGYTVEFEYGGYLVVATGTEYDFDLSLYDDNGELVTPSDVDDSEYQEIQNEARYALQTRANEDEEFRATVDR